MKNQMKLQPDTQNLDTLTEAIANIQKDGYRWSYSAGVRVNKGIIQHTFVKGRAAVVSKMDRIVVREAKNGNHETMTLSKGESHGTWVPIKKQPTFQEQADELLAAAGWERVDEDEYEMEPYSAKVGPMDVDIRVAGRPSEPITDLDTLKTFLADVKTFAEQDGDLSPNGLHGSTLHISKGAAEMLGIAPSNTGHKYYDFAQPIIDNSTLCATLNRPPSPLQLRTYVVRNTFGRELFFKVIGFVETARGWDAVLQIVGKDGMMAEAPGWGASKPQGTCIIENVQRIYQEYHQAVMGEE